MKMYFKINRLSSVGKKKYLKRQIGSRVVAQSLTDLITSTKEILFSIFTLFICLKIVFKECLYHIIAIFSCTCSSQDKNSLRNQRWTQGEKGLGGGGEGLKNCHLKME